MTIAHHNTQKGVIIILAPQRLTVQVSQELKDVIKEYMGNGHFKIVINLSSTRFMDSSGLGAIVSFIEKLRDNKGDIRLASPQKYIREILELTHINQVIQSFESESEAVDSFDK
jgi:anti-sigma B factor antagonist